ncbi:MAG: PaaI family thioesterase [Deltaproteobacteria bacterium]
MPEQKVATSPEDMLSAEDFATHSGFELLELWALGKIVGPPMAGTMNMRVESGAPGKAIFRGTPEFRHLNPAGTVHGGWYGTILDSCMTCAVTAALPKGQVCTTLEFKVNIIRPIPIGLEVLAEGECQHAGRTTAVATGRIIGRADGKLYATGSTTCMVFALP